MMNCQELKKVEIGVSDQGVVADKIADKGADMSANCQRRRRDPIEGLARRGLLTPQQVAVADMLARGGWCSSGGSGPAMSWEPFVDRSHGAGGGGAIRFDLDFRQWVARWSRQMALKEWPVAALIAVIKDRRAIRDTETSHALRNGSLTPLIGPALDLYVAL